MIKKMMLLAVSAAAVVAFAVPAAAQAEAIVTDSFGLPATEITAVSVDTLSTTQTGTLRCDTVHLEIALTKNDTESAVGSGTGTAVGSAATPHEGNCEVVQVSQPIVNITEVNVSNIELDGGGTGTASFTYLYDVAGVNVCHFEGTVPVSYTPGSNVISIAGEMTGKTISGQCNTAGVIHGNFTVTDAFGGAVVLH